MFLKSHTAVLQSCAWMRIEKNSRIRKKKIVDILLWLLLYRIIGILPALGARVAGS